MKETYFKVLEKNNIKTVRMLSKAAEIDIIPVSKKRFLITRVFVPSGHRQKGIGSELMKEVIHDADNECIELIVEPRPYIDRSDEAYEKLRNFYAKHGFINTKKGYMVRKPSCKYHLR